MPKGKVIAGQDWFNNIAMSVNRFNEWNTLRNNMYLIAFNWDWISLID